MQIRDATPDDADRVATVARASWHAAYDEVLGAATVDGVVDEWYDAESLESQISETDDTDAAFLVAVADGELVGFANGGPAREYDSDPDEPDAFLSRLYVHPDVWGKGHGSRLAGRLARRLDDAGYERVWLEVFEANERAYGFYEALGFEQVGAVTETFGGTDVTTAHLAVDVSTLVTATPSHG
jgi:ribosomal protein S18 acetylase RimI-like enzyme